MRITRVYQSISLTNQEVFRLDKNASHYLTHVLRSRVGDECYLFDGMGTEIQVSITDIEKSGVSVSFIKAIENKRESPLYIHLAQAVGKSDKMDWVLQKATELGVNEITPLLTDYCDVKLPADRVDTKMEHWKKIIIGATEQCGRSFLPTLNYPISLMDLPLSENTFLLSPRGQQSFSTLPAKELTLCIGPEGGFSAKEEAWAIQQNIATITLGNRILRTETAAIASIAAIQTLWGDFL
jgi:16S rRNA (uracil1498-N3)-methyltransferase